MEKTWRLQRYSRKDYGELVEFPVEIVGRDGVVRRYSFEDSIRLYRRRITFAPIRYRDVELVQAEVDHCRSRIDQLRRSYFFRHGWGTPEGQPAAVEIFGDLAGELAAFVCRVLRVDGRPEVRLEAVSDDGSKVKAASRDISTWYVVPKDSPAGMLLYVHRFEGSSADHVRERFFALLKDLERLGRSEGDAERLLAFHHTVDCGFVLTARGSDYEALTAARMEEDEPVPLDATPWDEVVETIRRGNHGEALARCRTMVTEQPWHRNAYAAGALLALHLDQPLVAEDFALVGSRYFPRDPLLHYHLGLSRFHQERMPEAVESLERAVAEQPTFACARLLLAVLLLQAGRHPAAVSVLAARRDARQDDRRAEASMVRVEQWLFWRRIMVGTGYASAALGLVATGLAGWFGLVPVVLGLLMAGAGMYAFRRELDRVAGWQRFEDVQQGLRRIRKTSRGDAPVS